MDDKLSITISGKALLLICIVVLASAGLGGYAGYSYSQLQTRLDYSNQINQLQTEMSSFQVMIAQLNRTNLELRDQLEKAYENITQLKNQISGLSKFERVEMQSALCVYDGTATEWNITMTVRNTGTAQATLDKVFINSVDISDSDGSPDPGGIAHNLGSGLTLTSGQSSTFYLIVDNPVTLISSLVNLSSGITINIKIHSTGGMEYLKLVELV